jgi:hypothetical protein
MLSAPATSSNKKTVGERYAEREAAKIAKINAKKAGLYAEYEANLKLKQLEAKIASETAKQLEKRNG